MTTKTRRTWTHTTESFGGLVRVHTWTSGDGAVIRATRTGGSLFPREWEVEGTEPGACGRWFAEETDGADEVRAAVRWLMRRMRFPAE
jgi:hypothetical protein